MKTTVVGVIGTATSAALDTSADVARHAQQLSLAEWASVAAIAAGFTTALWVSLQIVMKLADLWSKRRNR